MHLKHSSILAVIVTSLVAYPAIASTVHTQWISPSESLSVAALAGLIGAGYIPLILKLARSRSER